MNARIALAVSLATSLSLGCTCARSGIPNNQPSADATIRRDGFFEVGSSDGQLVIGDGEICNTTGGGQATREPATIMFVVDTSGSMLCTPSGGSDCGQRNQCLQAQDRAVCDSMYPDSRWSIFRPAMANAVSAIPDGNALGFINYLVFNGSHPNYTTQCPPEPVVAIGAAATTRAQIVQRLQQLHPIGPTPTSASVLRGLAALRASTINRSKFLVLATDGAANCTASCQCNNQGNLSGTDSDTRALIDAVRQATSEGIRTFVIGVPVSQEWVSVLGQIAMAGNGMFFDLNQNTDQFAQRLASAFGNITSSTISCSYTIPPNSGTFDVGNVNVRYTDAQGNARLIPRASTSSRDGWDYDNINNPTRIELVGPTCDTLRMADGRVDVLFGCPTVLQ